MLPVEAATELLIRTGWAGLNRSWVMWDGSGACWIDFDLIPSRIGVFSGGEQRLLRLAASIGGTAGVVVGDEVVGLDRGTTRLVLAAIAHAAGAHKPGRSVEFADDGTPHVVNVEALYSWPDE